MKYGDSEVAEGKKGEVMKRECVREKERRRHKVRERGSEDNVRTKEMRRRIGQSPDPVRYLPAMHHVQFASSTMPSSI